MKLYLALFIFLSCNLLFGQNHTITFNYSVIDLGEDNPCVSGLKFTVKSSTGLYHELYPDTCTGQFQINAPAGIFEFTCCSNVRDSVTAKLRYPLGEKIKFQLDSLKQDTTLNVRIDFESLVIICSIGTPNYVPFDKNKTDIFYPQLSAIHELTKQLDEYSYLVVQIDSECLPGETKKIGKSRIDKVYRELLTNGIDKNRLKRGDVLFPDNNEQAKVTIKVISTDYLTPELKRKLKLFMEED